MNVASLELCKELYVLSGWDGTYFCRYRGMSVAHGWQLIEGYKLKSRDLVEIVPAYDLGYLMRKLQSCGIQLYQNAQRDIWNCGIDSHYNHNIGSGSTPEAAACQLAIELFKHGVQVKYSAKTKKESGDAQQQ